MRLIDAIVLGIIEGITEYLPVSSTGHLILASSLMGLTNRVDKDSLDAFNIVIQGGAILAVLGVYRERVLQMMQGLLGRDPGGLRLAVNLGVAFVPAAVAGLALADSISRHLFYPLPVMAALAGGGLAMIGIGRWQRRHFHERAASDRDPHAYLNLESLTLPQAAIIGVIQCLAMWPGTSRSMVTIVGGMLVGMRPRHAAEFSFLLALPTLGAACAYSGAKSLMGDGATMVQALGIGPIAAGFVVATIAAAISVRWLVGFLTRHDLAVFGWYRIAVCVLLGILVLQESVRISPDEAAPSSPIVLPSSSTPSPF